MHPSCHYLYGIAKHAPGNQHEIVNCSAHLCVAQGTGFAGAVSTTTRMRRSPGACLADGVVARLAGDEGRVALGPLSSPPSDIAPDLLPLLCVYVLHGWTSKACSHTAQSHVHSFF